MITESPVNEMHTEAFCSVRAAFNERVKKFILCVIFCKSKRRWSRDLRPVAPLMQILKEPAMRTESVSSPAGDVVHCLIVSQGEALARLRWSSDCWALPHDCITFLTWCSGTVNVFISPRSVCLFYPHELLFVSSACFGDAGLKLELICSDEEQINQNDDAWYMLVSGSCFSHQKHPFPLFVAPGGACLCIMWVFLLDLLTKYQQKERLVVRENKSFRSNLSFHKRPGQSVFFLCSSHFDQLWKHTCCCQLQSLLWPSFLQS